jgi:3'-phosphoadenosine 5'-phosphosulfate sulfotransferase (PAPS reductase)/FAD synthetase
MMDIQDKMKDRIDEINRGLDDLLGEGYIIVPMLSGGDDSVVNAYVSSCLNGFKGDVIFGNTLTGDKETVDFVRALAKDQGWNVIEVKPAKQNRLPSMLATYGCMSLQMHPVAYRNLKAKPFAKGELAIRKRTHTTIQKLVTTTGRRRGEVGRSGIDIIDVQRRKNGKIHRVWVNPIADFTRADLESVFAEGFITRNPHAQIFGHSRECGCKTTMKPSDVTIENLHFEIYAKRRELQEAIAKASYELQEFEVAHGLLDREDATIPHGATSFDYRRKMSQAQLSFDDYLEDGTAFLCAGCVNNVAMDGESVGSDIDAELNAVKRAMKEQDNN